VPSTGFKSRLGEWKKGLGLRALKKRLGAWKKARGPGIKELRFTFNRIRKSPLSIVGIVIILFFAFVAVLAPYLAPPHPVWDVAKIQDPFSIPRAGNRATPSPPSIENPFGQTVDQFDLYYGCVWGTITAFRVGAYVVAIILVIGLAVGLSAGYYGGLIDEVLMRFTDIIIAFPGLILAMAFTIALPDTLSFSLILFLPLLAIFFIITTISSLLTTERRELHKIRTLMYIVVASASCAGFAAILGRYMRDVNLISVSLTRLDKVLVSLILVGWPAYTRVIRGEVLRTKNEDYVEAAKAVGCSDSRIILRHIVPNTIYPILILASLDIGSIVLTAAALSFLGIGAPSNYADWGQLVQKCMSYMMGQPLITYWYIWLIPGAFIFTFCLGWNLLGDAVRDILDPTLRRR
jgi:ABC-type dipeptide/oligopeptide/nickel transport system permease subunit